MRRWKRGVLRGGVAAVLLVLTGGCATLTGPTTWQPGNLQPLIVGWQQFFRIQWTATPAADAVRIDGYITNTWGFAAQQIRVLITGYDAAGQQVGQVIAWGPNEIDPGTRAYFDVGVPRGAASYDVSVFSWNWVQVGLNVNVP